jgi:hypothetical protein
MNVYKDSRKSGRNSKDISRHEIAGGHEIV